MSSPETAPTTREDLARRIAELSPEKRRVLEERARGQKGRLPIPPRQGAGTVFPLSFAQQRLWFLEQMQPDSSAYNVPSGLRLTPRGRLP